MKLKPVLQYKYCPAYRVLYKLENLGKNEQDFIPGTPLDPRTKLFFSLLFYEIFIS
jgi:hypothetical protein